MSDKTKTTPNMNNAKAWAIQSSILKPSETPSKEQMEKINGFFFVRWLSANNHTIPIAGILNRYYNMPMVAQYIFADDYSQLTGLPNKVKFIGIPKEKKNEEYQKLLDNIQRRYKINEEQSEEYFNLMDDSERDRMYNLYAVGLQK